LRRRESIPEFAVVLVGLKNEGNVGAVARVMKNFGFNDLRLVNCALGEEANKRAMHAGDILASAKIFSDFESSIKDLDIVVGTSGVDSGAEKNYLRHAISPEELLKKYARFRGKVGLVFGREDFGLLNTELERCDLLVKIDTSPVYPIMNVSHAVAVLLYVLRRKSKKVASRKPEAMEISELHLAFGELLDLIGYPEHRKKNAKVMFRRLVGRACITRLETTMLIGVFRRCAKSRGGFDEHKGEH